MSKITALGVSIIAGTLVFREFGPRVYLLEMENKIGLTKIHMLTTHTHPYIKKEDIYNQTKQFKEKYPHYHLKSIKKLD